MIFGDTYKAYFKNLTTENPRAVYYQEEALNEMEQSSSFEFEDAEEGSYTIWITYNGTRRQLYMNITDSNKNHMDPILIGEDPAIANFTATQMAQHVTKFVLDYSNVSCKDVGKAYCVLQGTGIGEHIFFGTNNNKHQIVTISRSNWQDKDKNRQKMTYLKLERDGTEPIPDSVCVQPTTTIVMPQWSSGKEIDWIFWLLIAVAAWLCVSLIPGIIFVFVIFVPNTVKNPWLPKDDKKASTLRLPYNNNTRLNYKTMLPPPSMRATVAMTIKSTTDRNTELPSVFTLPLMSTKHDANK